MSIHLDFETFSECDLPSEGLENYTAHPSTEILCMAWAVDDGPISIWKPGQEFPWQIKEALAKGDKIYAWNVQFEHAIWNRFFGELSIDNFACTMSMALTMGFPGSLEKAAAALKLDVEKDMKGKSVMMQLSKPKPKGGRYTRENAPTKFYMLHSYCMKDVEVERVAKKKLKELTPFERRVWLLDHKINTRGVLIDLESVKKAQKLIEGSKDGLDAEMRQVSNLEIESCSAVSQIVTFLDKRGFTVDSVDAEGVRKLLSLCLPDDVRRVLELRQEGSKSSTAKLAAMIERAGKDGRVRFIHQYYGAGTGRWSGRGLQTQNLPRPKLSDAEIEKAFELFHSCPESIEVLIGPPTQVVSDCIRGFIVPSPGSRFLDVDWANIEGRVLAWLAGEEWKVKAFEEFDKGIGPDLYLLSYSKTFYTPIDKVTKDQRQIGKVTELSMGYQGGKNAFQKMAKNYGVKVTDQRAEEIKNGWRKAHPKVVEFWWSMETIAIQAVTFPGHTAKSGKIAFRCEGDFLMCRLPSGRIMYYPFPEIEYDSKWGKKQLTYMGEDSYTRKWCKQKAYGGLLTENIVQGIARDILAESLLKLEEKDYPVVMHIHDQNVVEIKNGKGSLEEMEETMCSLPEWATGLPLAVDGSINKRFKK
jgi:DNA polymerase